MGFMNLSKGITNEQYIINNITTDSITKTRLQVLGILKGTKIIILNKRRSGVIIKVRGTRIGIDKKISNSINIRREEKNGKLEPCIYRQS